MFTCYLEPKETREVRERADRILAIIESLIEKEKMARIVVAGDFNHLLSYMAKGLERLKIRAIIP
jgi:metallophosphoesterase superfamily enzyme